MWQLILQLAIDPLTWVVGAGGVWLLRIYVEKRVTAGVGHVFDLRLEDHKQALQISADAARYDLERDLARANLYTTKAHTAAVDVYKALRIAHGSCLNLRGIRTQLTFEEFDRSDLSDYMTKAGVPNGKQSAILAQMDGDRDGAIAEMKGYLRMLEVQRADRDLSEARNVVFLNELYFDDAAIKTIDAFLNFLGQWMSYIHYPPDTPEERAEVPAQGAINLALEEVHTALRTRLDGTTPARSSIQPRADD